jgi:hypothetical protein
MSAINKTNRRVNVPAVPVPEDAEGFRNWLFEHAACVEAIVWATGKDLPEIWNTCPRYDWLWWLLETASIKVTFEQMVAIRNAKTQVELHSGANARLIYKGMADKLREIVPYPFGLDKEEQERK